MSQNAAFPEGIHCLPRYYESSETKKDKIHHNLEIPVTPLFVQGHILKCIASNRMGESCGYSKGKYLG